MNKDDLLVEQIVACEVSLDLVERNRELVVDAEVAAIIRGIESRPRRRKTGEGVGDISLAIRRGVCRQHAPHQNTASAAPYAGFDEIAGNVAIDRALREVAQIFETVQTNHRVRERRPVFADFTTAEFEFSLRRTVV